MTVGELITILNEVEDKDMLVCEYGRSGYTIEYVECEIADVVEVIAEKGYENIAPLTDTSIDLESLSYENPVRVPVFLIAQ